MKTVAASLHIFRKARGLVVPVSIISVKNVDLRRNHDFLVITSTEDPGVAVFNVALRV